MLLEFVKTDFIDNVSASMLSSKSKSESENICLMEFVISTISYAPGGSFTSKYTVSESGTFMEFS